MTASTKAKSSTNANINSRTGAKDGANADTGADRSPALPNERDTSPEANAPRPHKKMRQASEDLKQGQVDTDQHGERGIDQAINPGNVTESPKSPHDAEKK
jgi:hypothetical protein